jgi:hypothetical protein
MSEPKLEARIKELESQLALMNTRLNKLNDIEDIQRLQKSYGFYIQNWMFAELSDLFADSPDAELQIMSGIFSGKESVKNYFYSLKHQQEDADFLHQLMQLSGIVDVMPDGKTAKGRWFAYGSLALPRGTGYQALAGTGIYVSDYVKENGVWKILKLAWFPLVLSQPDNSWVKGEKANTTGALITTSPKYKADKPRNLNPTYPSGYIVPFHFVHPVTGKPTDVEQHNLDAKNKKQPAK